MNAPVHAPAATDALRGWRFVALLLLALAAAFALTPPHYGGDAVEYTLETVALAGHASPAIRPSDIERTAALAPQLSGVLDVLARSMDAAAPYPAFARTRGGSVVAVHFFGYPALAAAPFRLFAAIGIAPLKALQAVNYAAVFVLGLALRRFLRSGVAACLGLILFLLCGGLLYLNWTSPECVGAACLLAGLLLYLDGAPLAGAVLAGLAGQQNPTIAAFFLFAPLLKLGLGSRPTRADLAGLACGVAVYALAPLFNLGAFGVPNIIADRFSDPSLIGATRLVSLFFDLNQGMILAIPGVLAALAALTLRGWRASGDAAKAQARSNAVLLALCLLFTLALVLPALAVRNWNSGAAGIMRYAFWAAMPLLLALLLRLRARGAWPPALAVFLALAQGAAMLHAGAYAYTEFSPLARFALARIPQWYHPEPEIFAERLGGNDDYIDPDLVYVYQAPGGPRKTLANAGVLRDELLCGPGRVLAAGNRVTESTRGWRYLDGPPMCQPDRRRMLRYRAGQFAARSGIALLSGWRGAALSDGRHSRIVLSAVPGLHPASVMLAGEYVGGAGRTRIRVNGADLGWHRLDRSPDLVLPPIPEGAALTIDLEHEAAAAWPGSGMAVPPLALREVSLREASLHDKPG
jgi:hypothetical protein